MPIGLSRLGFLYNMYDRAFLPFSFLFVFFILPRLFLLRGGGLGAATYSKVAVLGITEFFDVWSGGFLSLVFFFFSLERAEGFTSYYELDPGRLFSSICRL